MVRGILMCNMKNCVRKETHDIGQLIMSQDKGSMSLNASKFEFEHFVSW